MVLKISSKFELRRFCRTTGAVAIVSILVYKLLFTEWENIFILLLCSCLLWKQLKLGRPNPDDLGHVDSVSVEEIGGVRVWKSTSLVLRFIICGYHLFICFL